jgi:hypothetical protein
MMELRTKARSLNFAMSAIIRTNAELYLSGRRSWVAMSAFGTKRTWHSPSLGQFLTHTGHPQIVGGSLCDAWVPGVREILPLKRCSKVTSLRLIQACEELAGTTAWLVGLNAAEAEAGG